MTSVDVVLDLIGDSRVVDDTRQLQAGDVLVWDSRVAPDKTTTVFDDARARGARLIVSDAAGEGVVAVADAGAVLAAWARARYPRQPALVLGVTGTSGKTSVAWFARQLAALAGRRSASIGTLGVMRTDTDADQHYTGFTSPTALKLHPILHTLAEEGVEICSLEISSHALALRRADGVQLAAAGYTNFSQDHLDFHKTLDEYFLAKMRLFTEVLPEGAPAVVNVGRTELWPILAVLKQRENPVVTVGTANAALVVTIDRADAHGLAVHVNYDGVPQAYELPLLGTFQAENLAVAIGLLVAAGIPWRDLVPVIGRISGVPGRMEIVKPAEPAQSPLPAVVVDYAHKPDALQKALQAVRPLTKGKLWVVFGCGGNRDTSKRPLMGAIAAQLADVVVVTDDNPRLEEAGIIRSAVLDGARQAGGDARIVECGEREQAIALALHEAGPDDVVLIAGKGHEQGQIVGTHILPFDDREVARRILSR